MTAGTVKCPLLFLLQGAAHYPAPRKAPRLEKMPLRCCRDEEHESFYSSVPQRTSGHAEKKKQGNYSPRWGRRCGRKSPKYRLVPLGDQIVQVEVQGPHRPLPCFVIAVYTWTSSLYRRLSTTRTTCQFLDFLASGVIPYYPVIGFDNVEVVIVGMSYKSSGCV